MVLLLPLGFVLKRESREIRGRTGGAILQTTLLALSQYPGATTSTGGAVRPRAV